MNFSGSQPNLVGPVMKETVYKVMKSNPTNNTVSDKVVCHITYFCKTYILENILIILIILCLVIFLMHRYSMSKTIKAERFNGENNLYKNNEDIEYKEKNKERNLYKEITDYQTRHLRYDDPPHMNPLMTPDDRNNQVNYAPDEKLINIPGVGLVDPKLLHPPKSNVPLNNVNYDYNNVYTNPSLSYYNGTYNTYSNAQDTDAINPYNWSNNFNTNTGAFVSPMTELNNKNLVDYQNILDNMNDNLIDAINQ